MLLGPGLRSVECFVTQVLPIRTFSVWQDNQIFSQFADHQISHKAQDTQCCRWRISLIFLRQFRIYYFIQKPNCNGIDIMRGNKTNLMWEAFLNKTSQVGGLWSNDLLQVLVRWWTGGGFVWWRSGWGWRWWWCRDGWVPRRLMVNGRIGHQWAARWCCAACHVIRTTGAASAICHRFEILGKTFNWT